MKGDQRGGEERAGLKGGGGFSKHVYVLTGNFKYHKGEGGSNA